MTATRRAGIIVAALCATTILTGCGGSDSDPVIKPTSDSASAATPDPDGYSPDQREVADVVTSWNSAAFAADTDEVGQAIGSLVTPDVLKGVLAAEAQQKPGSYVGDVTIDVQSVTVDGEAATVKACQDGSQAYRVTKGETEAGEGDPLVGATQLTIALVRQDGRWLISEPKGEPVPSC